MNADELKAAIDDHARWLKGDGGRRADLQCADLQCADLRDADLEGAKLRHADLRGAKLRDANLEGADLRDADLRGAKLRHADLRGAKLRDANLEGADLEGADLRGADLRGADLRGAKLRGADLDGANLRDADLRGANLEGADLRGANLEGADLGGASLPPFQIPQDGTLEVWKKLRDGVLARLEIPAGARRTATPVGRKCRAEFARVIEVVGADFGVSMHDAVTEYRVGRTVHPDRYDPDVRVECSCGIHFFLTREEAEAY